VFGPAAPPPGGADGRGLASDDRAHFGAGGQFRAGAVTGGEPIVIDLDPEPAPPPDPVVLRKRTLRYFIGGAVGVLAAGIVIVLAMTLTGNSPIRRTTAAPPPDTRTRLEQLCPPPRTGAQRQPAPPAPAGPRTDDANSGISYQAFGAPWLRWDQDWSDAGSELNVHYRTGQYFVTEPNADYLATILSGSVPASTNDAFAIDLKCTGQEVANDARLAFYPQPTTLDPIRNEETSLGGLPAWVSEFRLHFHQVGLRATSELVMLATIDVGRPNAAILYVSIPDTHRRYDYVIDQILASVRPSA
jgi:hypothetical protein